MEKYFIDNNSDKLILFFTGWGCDEHEFAHLKTATDVLLLYNYVDLNFYFDFSKYKEINLIAFSAGVFVASVLDYNFSINKKIAISGNPYLFDEELGLSKSLQDILYNITEDNADEFTRKYLIKTEDEYKNFHISNRTPDSCQIEFDALKKLYNANKHKIKNIFDIAFIGADDPLFKPSMQKNFYGDKLKLIENARHNMFFRIQSYEDILNCNIK